MSYALERGFRLGSDVRDAWDERKLRDELEKAAREAVGGEAMAPIEGASVAPAADPGQHGAMPDYGKPPPGVRPREVTPAVDPAMMPMAPVPEAAAPKAAAPAPEPVVSAPVMPQGHYQGVAMQPAAAMTEVGSKPDAERKAQMRERAFYDSLSPEDQRRGWAAEYARANGLDQGPAQGSQPAPAGGTATPPAMDTAAQPGMPSPQGAPATQPQPDAPAPTQQGQQGPAPQPLRPEQVSQLDQANAALMAQSRKALEMGRPDLALQYHQEGMKVRDQLRQQAFDHAMTRYRASGDPNAFVQMFNKYVDNGIDVERIEPRGDKWVIRGQAEGKAFEQEMARDEMEGFIKFAADPRAARAMEAERAQALWEQANEERLERVKGSETRKTEREKSRFQSVAPGASLVDVNAPEGGQPVFTAPEKAPTPKGFGMSVDPNTGDVLVQNKDTGAVSRQGLGGGGVRTPKHLSNAINRAADAINKAMGADSLNFDPNAGDRMLQSKSIASAMLQAADAAGQRLDPDLAAEAAMGLQAGKLPVVQLRDKQGRIRTVVEIRGKRIEIPTQGMPQPPQGK